MRTDRAFSADVHPQGNPHMNLSFDGGPHMIERIRDGAHPGSIPRAGRPMSATTRSGSSATGWRGSAGTASRTRCPKRTAAACLYHSEFDYLLGSLGLEIAAFLEPRPGLPATPSHLAKVVQAVRERRIPVVLTAPWSNNRNVERVTELTDAAPLELAIMVDG